MKKKKSKREMQFLIKYFKKKKIEMKSVIEK